MSEEQQGLNQQEKEKEEASGEHEKHIEQEAQTEHQTEPKTHMETEAHSEKQQEDAQEKRYKIKLSRVLIVLLIIAVIAYGAWRLTNQPYSGPGINISGNESPMEQLVVAAVVNGEPILMSDINRQLARVPEEYQGSVSAMDLINQSVKEAIMLQQASALRINITLNAVLRNINDSLYAQGIPEEILLEQLQQQNYTWDEFVEQVRRQMLIVQFINVTVLSKLNVSEKEIEAYYNASQYSQMNTSLADIHDDLKEVLLTQKAKPIFTAYLNMLWDRSNITIFLK